MRAWDENPGPAPRCEPEKGAELVWEAEGGQGQRRGRECGQVWQAIGHVRGAHDGLEQGVEAMQMWRLHSSLTCLHTRKVVDIFRVIQLDVDQRLSRTWHAQGCHSLSRRVGAGHLSLAGIASE